MNNQRSETSTVVIGIDHHDEVVIEVGVAIALASESGLREQIWTMVKARSKVLLTSDLAGRCPVSREIEVVLVNGKNGRDSMRTWNGRDLRRDQVDGNLYVVVAVVVVDLVEAEEALTDLARETMIDILKGMFVLIFTRES